MPKGELAIDPRGLIQEAYRMDIGSQDCRTIFFDWALGRPDGCGRDDIRALLDHYGPAHPDHPMTAVLREGLATNAAPPSRRGGWRSRRTE
jgi:hypothetical protein